MECSFLVVVGVVAWRLRYWRLVVIVDRVVRILYGSYMFAQLQDNILSVFWVKKIQNKKKKLLFVA